MLFKSDIGFGYDVLSLSAIYPAQSFQDMLPPWYANNVSCFQIPMANFFQPKVYPLGSEDVKKRNVVLIKFSEFPKQVLKAIGQVRDLKIVHDVIFLGEYAIYLGPAIFVNPSKVMPIGFWNYRRFCEIANIFTYGFDVISLYSHLHSISYNESISILYNYLCSRSFDSNETKGRKKRFYVQERNPLSHVCFNINEIDHLRAEITGGTDFKYYNKHGYIMFSGFLYECKDGARLKTFYTVCRHVNSQMLYVLPIFPDGPYPIYGIDMIHERKFIFLLKMK